jgi:hypothetical protein
VADCTAHVGDVGGVGDGRLSPFSAPCPRPLVPSLVVEEDMVSSMDCSSSQVT